MTTVTNSIILVVSPSYRKFKRERYPAIWFPSIREVLKVGDLPLTSDLVVIMVERWTLNDDTHESWHLSFDFPRFAHPSPFRYYKRRLLSPLYYCYKEILIWQEVARLTLVHQPLQLKETPTSTTSMCCPEPSSTHSVLHSFLRLYSLPDISNRRNACYWANLEIMS